jgi:hypothetical protein
MFRLFKKKYAYPEVKCPRNARELTEEEMLLVNGGSERRENSHEGVAGANVGDTIQRNDGTVVTLNQGDIDYAKAQLGIRDSGSGTSVSGSVGGSGSNGNTPSSPSSPTKTNDATANTVKGPDHHSAYDQQYINEMMEKEQKKALSGNGIQGTAVSGKRIEGKIIENNDDFLTPESNGKYAIDNKAKTIIVDKNNIDSVHDGYKAFYILSDRGYTFQVKDGAEVSETFNNDKDARKYVKELIPQEETLSDLLGNVSTATGVANDVMSNIASQLDDVSAITTISKYSKIASGISFGSGIYSTGADIREAIKNPNFDTISDVVIDMVGFMPEGGALASAGLSLTKDGIEKAYEETEKMIQYQAEYKFKDNFIPQSQNMMDISYLTMKALNYGVDLLFGRRW